MRYLLLFILKSSLFSLCFGQVNQQHSLAKTKVQYIELLNKIKWEEPERVFSLVEPGIFLSDDSLKSSIGKSKFGGQPDLPDSFNWPTFQGKPMVFFGQINLNQIHNFYQDSIFPESGILFFFCYFSDPVNEFGADYFFLKDKQEYQVLYFDGDLSLLSPRMFPKDLYKGYCFKEMPLKLELGFQVPMTLETWKYEAAGLTKGDEMKFDHFLDRHYECRSEMILGTPCPLQYGADFDWAYSYLNISDFKDPKLKEKTDKVRPDFVNLLSFSMEKRFSKIGDSNCYFGIRIQDLIKKDFKNVIFIMQGT